MIERKCKIMLKLDNWNDTIGRCRTNKYGANSHKQHEMKDISWFVKDLPPIDKYPVEITFKWHIKNSRADLDNKSCKAILDCLQNLGILENDNIKHINKITHEAIKDDIEYVEMEVKDGNI